MARLDSGTTDLRFAFPLPQLDLAANPCIYHVKREIINSSPKRRATLFGIIYLECFFVDFSLFVSMKAEINTLWKLLKFTILSFICLQLRQRYLRFKMTIVYRFLLRIRSNRLCATVAEIIQPSSLPFLLRNSFISFLAENFLDFHRLFIKILYSKLNISFNCILVIITDEITR